MDSLEIVSLRNSLGLSQSEFGQLLGAHAMTVSKWERGLAYPSPYQTALMQGFSKGAETKQKQISEELKTLLVAAGVVAALALLLGSSK
ncbi:MAG: helix-turn-helix domain-containing protein [Alphaproteobacteria bacterium]|nr:helix-turn-helix domain-containing protein [Alphaproteobacteria bacterium]